MNNIKQDLSLKPPTVILSPPETLKTARPNSRSYALRTAILAFAAVYLIWGSTFVAIRVGIESLSPWLLVFGRFALAGGISYGIGALLREESLNRKEVLVAMGSGSLLIFSNGLVAVSEKTLASGLVAVVIGALPIWIMLIGWAFFGQARPTLLKLGGALFGLAGIGLIAGSHLQLESSGLPALALLMLSTSMWAFGTLVQRRLTELKSLFRFTGLQMLTGSVLGGLLSLGTEAPWTLDFARVSPSSWAAVVYLAIFGSVIAFTAFNWLTRHVETHLVSTYALVNPVIAVGLGWLFFSEPVTGSFAAAVACVLIGVSLMMKR